MIRVGSRALPAAILAMLMISPVAAADGPAFIPEPPGLWAGPMVSDTPATLKGARVIDIPGLEVLMPQKPLLIDVGPADRKPDRLPSSTIWKPAHRSIPGAVWFPGAGSADLPDEKVDALLRRIAELRTGTNPHRWSRSVVRNAGAVGTSANASRRQATAPSTGSPRA